ncbi:JmjC domain-containing protein [Nocardia sp. CA-290969]|uniref:JmjC domain-containing protein n=1 Tax=Nocardia sp. CA-290969 TaxID=3239986 RepID=UPI003D8DA7F7
MSIESRYRTVLLDAEFPAGGLIRWDTADGPLRGEPAQRCSGNWMLDQRAAQQTLHSLGAPDVRSEWPIEPVPGVFSNLKELGRVAGSAYAAAVGGALEVGRVRVMRDGEPLDRSEFDRSERVASFGAARIDPLRLRSLLAAGACMSIFGVQEMDPSVAAICARAAAASGARVGASLFYSSPDSHGYPPHYDEFHSLLLQIDGSKLWSVKPGPVAEPGVGHSWPKVRSFYPRVPDDVGQYDSEAVEFTLEPGAALWIPAGWIHSGIAGPLGSTHLTLSFNAWHVFELLRILVGDSGSVAGTRREVVAGEMAAKAVLETACTGLESFAAHIRSDIGIGNRLLERMLFAGPAVPYASDEEKGGSPGTSDLETPVAIRHCASCVELHLGDRIVQVPAGDPLFERIEQQFDENP